MNTKQTSLDLLARLVSLNSVFPHEKAIGEVLERELRQRGFRVRRQLFSSSPERFNLLAEKGTGPALLLYGHMDTVPAYGTWGQDPFKLV